MKILMIIAVAVMFSGCINSQVESMWTKGKIVGGVVLKDETKAKLKPMVEATEEVYEAVNIEKK